MANEQFENYWTPSFVTSQHEGPHEGHEVKYEVFTDKENTQRLAAIKAQQERLYSFWKEGYEQAWNKLGSNVLFVRNGSDGMAARYYQEGYKRAQEDLYFQKHGEMPQRDMFGRMWIPEGWEDDDESDN